jgi:hypothetical protein
MWKWLKLSFGRSCRTLLLLLVLTGTVSSCGPINPLSSLTGNGTNVAANTQIGKTNTQTIGTTRVNEPKVVVRPRARVESIDQSNDTQINNELPPYVWLVLILALIVGWVTDTPSTYIENFRKKRKEKRGKETSTN